MKAKQQGEKKARTRYSAEFKEQALKRAEKDGVATAARDLELAQSQIYGWRQKKRLDGLTTEEQKHQHVELAKLKREVARLEEKNAFLKKGSSEKFVGKNVEE